MPCAVIRDLIPLYMEGELSRQSRQLVEGHLEQCPQCAEWARHSRLVVPAELVSTESNGSRRAVEQVRRRIRYFLALVIVLALTSTGWSFQHLGATMHQAQARLIRRAATHIYAVGRYLGEQPDGATGEFYLLGVAPLDYAQEALQTASLLARDEQGTGYRQLEDTLWSVRLALGHLYRRAQWMAEDEARSHALLEEFSAGLLAMWPFLSDPPPRDPALLTRARALQERAAFFNANGILPEELPSLLTAAEAMKRAREQLPALAEVPLPAALPHLSWREGVHYWTLHPQETAWRFVEIDMITGVLVGEALAPLSPDGWLPEPWDQARAARLAQEFARTWPHAQQVPPEAWRRDSLAASSTAPHHFAFVFMRTVEGVPHETDVLEIIVDGVSGRVSRYQVLRWGTSVPLLPTLSPDQARAITGYSQDTAQLVVAWSERSFMPTLVYRLDDALYVNAHSGVIEGYVPWVGE